MLPVVAGLMLQITVLVGALLTVALNCCACPGLSVALEGLIVTVIPAAAGGTELRRPSGRHAYRRWRQRNASRVELNLHREALGRILHGCSSDRDRLPHRDRGGRHIVIGAGHAGASRIAANTQRPDV